MKKQTKKVKVYPDDVVSALNIPTIPKNEIIVMDKDIVPMIGMFGRSPEVSYPNEFALIDSMKVGQSAVFNVKKQNIVDAIRNRLKKISDKKFVCKKVNKEVSRIWRVKDGMVTRHGGRQAKSERGPKLTKNGVSILDGTTVQQ